MNKVLSVFLCLFLLGCPPADPKDELGNEIQSVTLNNGVTRVNYLRGLSWELFYSCAPETHNAWYDANGVWAPNTSTNNLGQRLTEFWQLKNQTEYGKGLIKTFNEIIPEEESK